MPQRAARQFESLSEAAERTGLSVRTLRRRIAAGQLQGVGKVGFMRSG